MAVDWVKRIVPWTGLVILGVLLAGCNRLQAQQLSPEEITARSADRMKALKGFEYLIQRTGAPVFLDYEETIVFNRAEGQYVSPDRVFANVRLVTPGLIAEIKIISIGGVQWSTNFLTGEWEATDPLYSFNPSLLFDAEDGIQVILAKDMINPVLVGMEELPEIPGKKLYAIQATVQGNHLNVLSYGMIDDEMLQIKVWVDPGSFDLDRILLVDPANPGNEEDTTWQIDFWNFDKTFDIEQPVPNNQ